MIVDVLGAGKIGDAVARSIAKSEKISKVIITKRNISTLGPLQTDKIEVTQDNKKAANESDLIIVAVKAGDAKHVLSEISEFASEKIIISLMAAISIRKLESSLPNAKIVRTMPNIAATIGEAITAYSLGHTLTKK